MKRAFTTVEAFIVLGVVSVLAVLLVSLLLPTVNRTPQNAYRSACASNLKQIGLASLQYRQVQEDKLPLTVGNVNSASFGWADALLPYLKDSNHYQCPLEAGNGNGLDPRSVGYTDYWMNSRLSGMAPEEIREQKPLILFGEGNDGADATDARYAIDALPKQWLTDKNSPAYRHLGGANYAFVDGHTKWYRAESIKSDAKGPTLLPITWLSPKSTPKPLSR
jgi:prepilin-type processing-associated H-X9-DG protein